MGRHQRRMQGFPRSAAPGENRTIGIVATGHFCRMQRRRRAMLTTRFTELVGCQVPIQQAGMGGVAGPPLVAAVCRAGALGTLPMAAVAPFAERIQQVVAAAPGPLAVNVLMPFLTDRGDVEAAAEHARIVEFFWADPDPTLIDLVHDRGALAAWQVGTVDGARAAADAGCDLVIAQGVEAGG